MVIVVTPYEAKYRSNYAIHFRCSSYFDFDYAQKLALEDTAAK